MSEYKLSCGGILESDWVSEENLTGENAIPIQSYWVNKEVLEAVYIKKEIDFQSPCEEEEGQGGRNQRISCNRNNIPDCQVICKRVDVSSIATQRSLNIIHSYIRASRKPRVYKYKCGECDKKFVQTLNLKIHMRSHTGEIPYKCSTCAKGFATSSNLKRHISNHTGGKPYKCEYCDQWFEDLSDFARHLTNHTDKCCNKPLRYQHDLTEHLTTHMVEESYKCEYCGKQFNLRYCLLQHVNRIHTGDKPFKCHLCNAQFSRKCTLISHVRSHTGENRYDGCV